MKRAFAVAAFTIVLLLLVWLSSRGARGAAWATGASGIIGSLLIALPFFLEDSLKWLATVLRRGKAGDPAAAAAIADARSGVEAVLGAWSPSSRALIVAGLLYLALSYALGVVTFELTG
ncbi:MAG: hypothetical protein R3D25_07345 [Geminicoccaceae bacterium]